MASATAVKAFELEAIPTSVLSFIPCFVVSEASPWPFEYTTFPSFIIPTDIPGTSKVFRVFCTRSSSCFSLICANVKKEKRIRNKEKFNFILRELVSPKIRRSEERRVGKERRKW